MNLFFDLDGTLINSLHRHYVVLMKALRNEKINIEVDENEYLNTKREGLSNKKFLSEKYDLPQSDLNRVNEYWIDNIEDEQFLRLDSLYKDSVPTLLLLENVNNIFFLTARKNKTGLENELFFLKLKQFCDQLFIVDPECGKENKKEILSHYDKKNTMMIGDTEADYTAALDNGIRSYILNRGLRNKSFWDKRKVISYEDLGGLYSSINKENF